MELFTTPSGQILIGIVIVINIASLLIMVHDKHKSVRGHNTHRTPEGLFFFMAAMFGGVGVYLGMQLFRHKTRTWYFQIGIPFLIFQNLATIYVIWKLILI